MKEIIKSEKSPNIWTFEGSAFNSEKDAKEYKDLKEKKILLEEEIAEIRERMRRLEI